MKMRPTTVLRLLALVLVCSATVTLPSLEASGGYVCGPFRNGPPSWGTGATCEEARADLQVNAEGSVYCEVFCYRELVITGDCFWNDMKGMYQMDGYLRYSCEECGFVGGEACL